MYISIQISGASQLKVLKSPHGLMYRLHEISILYTTGTSGFVFVLDYGKHEITDFSLGSLVLKNCICGGAFSSAVAISSRWSFYGLVDTKFLSIITTDCSDVGVLIIIVAELVKISRENALLEYLMKSR